MPLSNNTVNQDQIHGWIYAEFFTLHYRTSAGDWVNIPGIESLSQSGAEAPMRDVVSVNGAPTQAMGISRTGNLTFNAKIMPNDRAWRDLRRAQINRDLVHFRIDTDATLLDTSNASDNATFATTGSAHNEVDWTAGAEQEAPDLIATGYGRGAFIVAPKTGTKKYYIVDNVTKADTPVITVLEWTAATGTYAAPSSDVSATTYNLYGQIPMRQRFSALVPSATNMELSNESEMMTTLTLALRSRLSEPEIIAI